MFFVARRCPLPALLQRAFNHKAYCKHHAHARTFQKYNRLSGVLSCHNPQFLAVDWLIQ